MILLVFLTMIGRIFQHPPASKTACGASVLKPCSLKDSPFNKEESGIYKEKEYTGKYENGLKPQLISDRFVFCTDLGAGMYCTAIFNKQIQRENHGFGE